MSEKKYSYEQLDSALNKLDSFEIELKNSSDKDEFPLKVRQFLSFLKNNEIISDFVNPILKKDYKLTLEKWLEKNKKKDGLVGRNSVKLPENEEEKLFIISQFLERIEQEGMGVLFGYFVCWTGKTEIRKLVPLYVSFMITPSLDIIRDYIGELKVSSESSLKPSFNLYNHSIHNETKGNHAPVTISTIQINSDKKDEIINTLRQAFSKIDEIQDEDQRELASEYLEQTLEEVETGNIKPVKLEKRKKFFEKHKIDWVGLTGLALGAIQVIQNLL